MKFKLILLLLIGIPLSSIGQFSSEKEMLLSLCGETYRVWCLSPEFNQSSGITCSGELGDFVFNSNKTVEVIDEYDQIEIYKYKLNKVSKFEWYITINSQKYRLLFFRYSKKGYSKIKLRLDVQSSSDVSIVGIQDIVIYSEI